MSHPVGQPPRSATDLLLSEGATRLRRVSSLLGRGFLLLVTAASAFAVLFIFIFIIRESLPFFFHKGAAGGIAFDAERFRQFFTSTRWYPTDPGSPEYGHLLRQRAGHGGGDRAGRAAGSAGGYLPE
jgi:ABC-type phosphate transport system permease subunit